MSTQGHLQDADDANKAELEAAAEKTGFSKSASSTAASPPKASSGGARASPRRASTRSTVVPPSEAAIAAAKSEMQLAHNRNLLPLQELLRTHLSGVVPFTLRNGPGSPVSLLCEFLQENWHGDQLVVRLNGGSDSKGGSNMILRGYTGYGRTAGHHDPKLQGLSTVMIQRKNLVRALTGMPGFADVVEELRAILEDKFGLRFSLRYGHILKQSKDLNGATTFAAHIDTDDTAEGKFVTHTGIVKLTTDRPGEFPSRMMVIGAHESFTYGSEGGSGGAFLAGCYHESGVPQHEEKVLKFAGFFRGEPLPPVSQRASPSSSRAELRSVTPEPTASPISVSSAEPSPAKPPSVSTAAAPWIAAWLAPIDPSSLAPHLLPRAADAPERMDLAELARLLGSGRGDEVLVTVCTERRTLGTHDLSRTHLRSCCTQEWVRSELVNAYAALVVRAAGSHVGALPTFFVDKLMESNGGCVAFRHHSPIFAHRSRAAHAM